MKYTDNDDSIKTMADADFYSITATVTDIFVCKQCKEKTEWMLGWNTYEYDGKKFCSYNCKCKYLKTNLPTKAQMRKVKEYEHFDCPHVDLKSIKQADVYLKQYEKEYLRNVKRDVSNLNAVSWRTGCDKYEEGKKFIKDSIQRLIDEGYAKRSIISALRTDVKGFISLYRGEPTKYSVSRTRRILEQPDTFKHLLYKVDNSERCQLDEEAIRIYLIIYEHGMTGFDFSIYAGMKPYAFFDFFRGRNIKEGYKEKIYTALDKLENS